MTEEQIKSLLEEDTGILLGRLGKELWDGSENPGLFCCIGSRHYRELAVSWLRKHRDKIAELICEDIKIVRLYKPIMDNPTKVQLVVAVFDLVSGTLTGIPPWTVSVLLVKFGIENICKGKWENNESYNVEE